VNDEVSGYFAPGYAIHIHMSRYYFSHGGIVYYFLAEVATQSDIRDQRYQTEPDIGTSDIGLKSAEFNI
jgi:hypothetical protein